MAWLPNPIAGAIATITAFVVVASAPANPAHAKLVRPEAKPEGGLDVGEAKCSVTNSHAAPFVVEWEGSDRAQLEAAVRRGMVTVRYDGCEIELVAGCTAPVAYDYAALTPKKESIEIVDAGELYARFPRGAVKLEAALERAGSLAVDMMLVGRLEAREVEIDRERLEGGSCTLATHVVTGLTVGAFRLHTGAKADIGVELSAGQAGAGGQRLSEREELSTDGDPASCEGASVRDTEPPVGCGALIRIEVLPLQGAGGVSDFGPQGAVEDFPGLFARGTRWRRPAVIGMSSFAAAIAGMAMLTVGIVMVSDSEDIFTQMVTDPQKRATGLALAIPGGIAYFGGIAAGITFMTVAGVRRNRAKREAEREAGLSLLPGGLRLRF